MAAGIKKRLIHWIFQSRKKDCRSFCLFCEYWNICRNDKGDSDEEKETDKSREETYTQ